VDHLAEKGPLTPGELRRDLEDIVLMDSFVKDLRVRGAIEGIGLTPTDILHAAGTYVAGDVEAARMGVRLFTRVLGVEEDVLIDRALSEVSTRIADEVVRKLLTDQLGPLPDSPSFQGILDLVTAKRRCPSLDLKATVQLPVVGLGAPAKAFVAPLSNILGMEVIIPPDHDVGNAVGAVCGQVSEFVDVYVYPRDKGYAVFSSLHSPIPCGGEDAAVKRARELATRYALERAEGAGGRDLKVELEIEEERGVSTSALQKDELVQMRVRARAVGSAMED
jgi:N-methylhydantoinase A/oxoprolinase/acetone carboxylase beta subunit